MTQWSRFKRYHGYKQDPYWYGERPRGLTLRRVFACLSCLLGGVGELRKGRRRRQRGGRKYRSDKFEMGDDHIDYRDDTGIGLRYSMYSS
jgi:hypothetical protein